MQPVQLRRLDAVLLIVNARLKAKMMVAKDVAESCWYWQEVVLNTSLKL